MMQPVWKILAPVDLNSQTGVAVEHAIEFANAIAGELVLLHVLEPVFHKEGRKAGWPLEAMGELWNSVPVRRVVLPGAPASTICRYADSIHADMVLLTPRSRGDWTRFWRGSVTAEVLDLSERPVQLANPAAMGDDFQFRCRRVLCVVNLDGTDDSIIGCATTIAARSGADIAILHVLPEASDGLVSWGLAQSDRPLSRAVALDRIRDLGDALPESYTTSVMVGGLHKNIVVAARQTSADLIIVGRNRPRTWAAFSPNAQAVLRRVTCPVLSVPVSAVQAHPEPVRRYRHRQREDVLCDI